VAWVISDGVRVHTGLMSQDMTDGDLLVRIGEGDADAFTMLWRRLSGPVLALGRRTLADDAAAEDVAQETFATIWRVAATFDPERGAPAGWIFTIARNAARDVACRRRLTVVDDVPDTVDPALGPEDEAVRAAERFRIHVALASLNPRAREVIDLAYFEGLTQSEIAERIDLPLGTVKTRTRNALARLAESLEPAETL
jgi:RNA polymerase sigma-70 factor (ECF subfamily)